MILGLLSLKTERTRIVPDMNCSPTLVEARRALRLGLAESTALK